MRLRRLVIGLAAIGAVGACGQEAPPPATSTGSASTRPAPSGSGPASSPAQSPAGDAARGRQIYLAQCAACHSTDPGKAGPVGPPVQGSSHDLLAAKILEGTYPPGYVPKRDSKVMPPRPDLGPTIPDLAAYLR
jgi:mono/diheme cytochrome c family protein